MGDETIVLAPGAGRAYEIGAMRGVFKAADDETDDRWCASEWTVAPRSAGPGPHVHDDNEELFLVTEGTMTFLVGERCIEASRGTFLRIPAGVTHDFRNDTDAAASAFNVFVPGGRFESALRGWLERAAGRPHRAPG